MNEHSKKRGTVYNLKQMYKLPTWNADFSFYNSLPAALGWGLAYGFVFFWVSKFLGGPETKNYSLGVIGVIAGFISTLATDRWKIGWALDELFSPILLLIVFMAAWYLVS